MEENFKETERKMDKSVEAFKRELSTLRAGRAVPSLLDRVQVDYYNTPTPLNQLATISTPEPRLLLIQPWDKNVIGAMEKAILKSDLGLTPNNDGTVIRLNIPQLTEERRKELVRYVRKKAEEGRVAIRNIRREGNELLKNEEKKGDISEDDRRLYQEEIQDMTNKRIEEVDNYLAEKEKEIMEV